MGLLSKALHRGYGRYLGRSFAAFGRGAQINYPALINSPASIEVGARVWIREHAWLNCVAGSTPGPRLVIGEGSYLGRFVHINAYESVVIESSVLISDRVFISDVHHEWRNPDVPIIEQGVTAPRPVRLKTGCWIGIGAVIMPGVTIGRNAIVGANAVVTRDVPDHMVALGVPARVSVLTPKS